MASPVPVKSQPVHSFTFPHLRWSNNGNPLDDLTRLPSVRDGYVRSPWPRSVILVGPSSIRGEPSGTSPIPEGMERPVIDQGESEEVPRNSELGVDLAAPLIEYRRNYSRNSSSGGVMTSNGVISSGSKHHKAKFMTTSEAAEADASGNKRPKLLIRLPCKNLKQDKTPQSEPPRINPNDEHGETKGAPDEVKTNNCVAEETKPWNLRPRKGPLKPHCGTITAVKDMNDSKMPDKSKAEQQLMNSIEAGDKEGKCGGSSKKNVKRKLTIVTTLTKEEIDADVFAMNGLKPSRRPKKRARNIQKQLENLLPGSWLVSITTDSYKVSQSNSKGQMKVNSK